MMFDRWRGKRSTVTMISSVGGDLVAGETYKLPLERADELIVKGYAEGDLSREYGHDEVLALRGPTQVIRFE